MDITWYNILWDIWAWINCANCLTFYNTSLVFPCIRLCQLSSARWNSISHRIVSCMICILLLLLPVSVCCLVGRIKNINKLITHAIKICLIVQTLIINATCPYFTRSKKSMQPTSNGDGNSHRRCCVSCQHFPREQNRLKTESTTTYADRERSRTYLLSDVVFGSWSCKNGLSTSLLVYRSIA